jgi:uncharacterized membrane protein YeaQ/YmgE (transglycosylase-associated protein family)
MEKKTKQLSNCCASPQSVNKTAAGKPLSDAATRPARTPCLYTRLRPRFGGPPIVNSTGPPKGRWTRFLPGRGLPSTTRRSRQKESDMSFIIWLIVGGIVGWLASLVMRTDGQQGILLNVVVGIVGSFLGGWLISPLVGVGNLSQGISIGSIIVSLVGAIILLAIVNLFRRGRVR